MILIFICLQEAGEDGNENAILLEGGPMGGDGAHHGEACRKGGTFKIEANKLELKIMVIFPRKNPSFSNSP